MSPSATSTASITPASVSSRYDEVPERFLALLIEAREAGTLALPVPPLRESMIAEALKRPAVAAIKRLVEGEEQYELSFRQCCWAIDHAARGMTVERYAKEAGVHLSTQRTAS